MCDKKKCCRHQNFVTFLLIDKFLNARVIALSNLKKRKVLYLYYNFVLLFTQLHFLIILKT